MLTRAKPDRLVPIAFVCLAPFLSLNPLVFGQATSKADNPHLHQAWTTENGLPQNSVEAIAQTRDGYLWIGTFGGLARFDGVNFTIFDVINSPVLTGNRIRALYADDEGSLWIGAEYGALTRYRQGVFTNYSVKDGLPDDSVISYLVISLAKGADCGFPSQLARPPHISRSV